MDIFSYLKNYSEEMPDWLFNYDGYKLNFHANPKRFEGIKYMS